MTESSHPILYSFRRCPYAMRARLALQSSGQTCRLREIVLRDKPAHMTEISPKATVPVLQLEDGTVLEESLDVMLWALDRDDPENWLSPEVGDRSEMLALIQRCEDEFKGHLDRYKYATRYEGADPIEHRTAAERFLGELEQRLQSTPYLYGKRPALADFAIAPFIRQFANTDRDWFDTTPYPHLQKWLDEFLASDRFAQIMEKRKPWKDGDPVTLKFGDAA